MTTLLILGETGQLARALARLGGDAFETVECAGRSRANLAAKGEISSLIERLRPDSIINAAAFTDVDGAEANPEAAFQINAHGAEEAAAAAHQVGARFVHVSTDYVFGADGPGPYDETAAPAPVNVYGHSKLAGETAVLAANPNAAVVRTAAVFSGGGADFPSAMWSRAHAGQSLRVVDDQLTCPTFADDLALRLIALSQNDTASGIFHCAGQPAVSWFAFARAALDLMNTPVEIMAVPSAAFQRPAPRPSDSRLIGDRLELALKTPSLRWRVGLERAYDVWKAAHK